jgi:hypothetical protein
VLWPTELQERSSPLQLKEQKDDLYFNLRSFSALFVSLFKDTNPEAPVMRLSGKFLERETRLELATLSLEG